MSTIKWSLGLAVLCMLVGSAFASTTEHLYVQEGPSIVSYAVSNTTAKATKLGSAPINGLSNNFPIHVIHAPTLPYVYVLGFTEPTAEFIWVFKAGLNGLLGKTPIQILAVKPALTQFFIHPNSTFAYALYSWTTPAPFENVADIVLFTINQKTGLLTNTKKVVTNYPPNPNTLTSLYGFNSAGSEFYIHQSVPSGITIENDWYSYAVNAKTGALTQENFFWRDSGGENNFSFSAISDKLISLSFYSNDGTGSNGINIYPNEANAENSTALITCTSAMLLLCGDEIDATFHPSGAYLFVNDITTGEVPIAYISTVKSELEASGASIPGIPGIIAFSPDGLLVFALEGNQILAYVFNPHSGLLTAETIIPVSSVASMVAAK